LEIREAMDAGEYVTGEELDTQLRSDGLI
jgi:hypothetical protein